MRKLLCFVFGMMSVILIIPVLENSAQIFEAFASKVITNFGLDISKNQKTISETQASLDQVSTHAIGFTAEGYDDEYEDEE